ncbi:MAG TPA: right-handed parallel beta-helix repeat-containing protein, partial [Saprospiraceae bacterium]|nr:right-handed parallel beta-helix repeat-containing protein [Saprospiraceae bacterium]HMP23764.1 right-handed parallel beta-helix repeat-containing protein [Saprospiraceae bacterium]
MKQIYTRIAKNIQAAGLLLLLLLPGSYMIAQGAWVNSSGVCAGGVPCYTTLSAAIAGTPAGQTILMETSVTEAATVIVNKSLTINGGNNTLTSNAPYHGLRIAASGVTLQNLTVTGAGTFGIITAPGSNNLVFTNVMATANGANVNTNDADPNNDAGSGFSITGVSGVVMTNITSTNNIGNGISIVASQNVTITNVTTSGNTFSTFFQAGIGIFSSADYTPCTSSDITINGMIMIAENVLVYQEDDESDNCTFPNITNVSVGPPAAFFVGVCTSSDGAYTRSLGIGNIFNLQGAYTQALGLQYTNIYGMDEIYIQDLNTGNYYSGSDNFATASADDPCDAFVPYPDPIACTSTDILPEIGFNVNGIAAGNINNGEVDDSEDIRIIVCDEADNISCEPFPITVTNADELPDGASVGVFFSFTSNNVTINGIPVVNIQGCIDDLNGPLLQFFEPASVRLIDPTQPGMLELVITPFIDTNGNCAYEQEECAGETITITLDIPVECVPPTATIEDPCSCAEDGFFEDAIVITSGATGQTWTLVANTGLIDPNTQQLFPTDGSVTFTDNGDGTYSLIGLHANVSGYEITAQGPFYQNADNLVNLTVENACARPEPVITSYLPAVLCANSAPIVLTGNGGLSPINGMAVTHGTGIFTISNANENEQPQNEEITELDATAYVPGNYIITLTWDAGDPANEETKVGCVGSVEQAIAIDAEGITIVAENTTWTLADCTNDQNQVTLCYSFNLLNCGAVHFDPLLLDVNFGGLTGNLVSNVPFTQSAGEEALFVEFCFEISAEDVGIYPVIIDYSGVDVTVQIQILAREPITDYSNLSCSGTVNIRLDEDCEAQLRASQLLNGRLVCD